ncbi:CU044_5270 family protein [Arthrobacter sp. YD2]|uniref:CU044_5270 family protein n=1 Tax=Arthrobacter sp. YD2 TaxID=3058046 RepID=UPI0025B32002|nr:CU044_5270 family protein [Arthrobacter sp. YD2]MDN3903166.1 CU044_5270 family protein [Arthrobacter sp. YD2]
MDELHLLRATRNTTGTVPPAVLAAGREKLLQKAAEEVREPAPVLHPRRPWRRAVFAVSAAAALIAALVAVDVVGAGERPGATAEAAQVLNDAAATTIAASDPVLAPGQYLLIDTKAVYTTTTSTENGEFVWLNSQDGQVYVPADRTAEWIWNREPSEPVQFFDEASRLEAERQAAQEQVPAETFPFEKQPMRAREGRFYDSEQRILGAMPLQEGVANAPRDPDELLELIYENTNGQGPTADEEAFITIADTLRTGVIPADLRGALYQAAALIPGVTVVDREAALDGRTGISLGMKSSRYEARREIIIDPDTGQLIGEREILLEDLGGIPSGTATAWTAVTTSVVDSAP